MRTILIAVALAGCGSPRQPLPAVEPTVHEQLAAMDEPIDAAVDAEPDAEVDASLAFIAEPVDAGPSADDIAAWDKLPTLALESAGDAAEAANRKTVADVLAEEATSDEPDETYENGVRVVFTNVRPACGRKDGRGNCGFDMRMCRALAKGCAAAKNIACFVANSRTDGSETPFCSPTYGECERFRSLAALSEEYELSDCTVMRYRKAGAE